MIYPCIFCSGMKRLSFWFWFQFQFLFKEETFQGFQESTSRPANTGKKKQTPNSGCSGMKRLSFWFPVVSIYTLTSSGLRGRRFEITTVVASDRQEVSSSSKVTVPGFLIMMSPRGALQYAADAIIVVKQQRLAIWKNIMCVSVRRSLPCWTNNYFVLSSKAGSRFAYTHLYGLSTWWKNSFFCAGFWMAGFYFIFLVWLSKKPGTKRGFTVSTASSRRRFYWSKNCECPCTISTAVGACKNRTIAAPCEQGIRNSGSLNSNDIFSLLFDKWWQYPFRIITTIL